MRYKTYKLVLASILISFIFGLNTNIHIVLGQSTICTLVNGKCKEQGNGCPVGTECLPKNPNNINEGCSCQEPVDPCEDAIENSKGSLSACSEEVQCIGCPEGYDSCERRTVQNEEIQTLCCQCLKTCYCGNYPAGSTWCDGNLIKQCKREVQGTQPIITCTEEVIQTCDVAKCLTCGGIPLQCVTRCAEGEVCRNGQCVPESTPTPTSTPTPLPTDTPKENDKPPLR